MHVKLIQPQLRKSRYCTNHQNLDSVAAIKAYKESASSIWVATSKVLCLSYHNTIIVEVKSVTFNRDSLSYQRLQHDCNLKP